MCLGPICLCFEKFLQEASEKGHSSSSSTTLRVVLWWLLLEKLPENGLQKCWMVLLQTSISQQERDSWMVLSPRRIQSYFQTQFDLAGDRLSKSHRRWPRMRRQKLCLWELRKFAHSTRRSTTRSSSRWPWQILSHRQWQGRSYQSRVGSLTRCSWLSTGPGRSSRGRQTSGFSSSTRSYAGGRTREGGARAGRGDGAFSCRNESGAGSKQCRPAATDVVVAASSDQPTGEGFGSQSSSGPPHRRSQRRGQRERFIIRRIRGREGLCGSRSLPEANHRGQESDRSGEAKCSHRTRHFSCSRRTFSPSQLSGAKSSDWRSQNSDSGRLHACSSMGDGGGAKQHCFDGLCGPDDGLRGASILGRREDSIGLVDDWTERAKLPTAKCEPSSEHTEPILTVGLPDLDCSKCVLPKGHRHFRDQTSTDWCDNKAALSNPRHRCKGGKGEKNQEEGRKGRRRSARSLISNSNAVVGIPEQRSSGQLHLA